MEEVEGRREGWEVRYSNNKHNRCPNPISTSVPIVIRGSHIKCKAWYGHVKKVQIAL